MLAAWFHWLHHPHAPFAVVVIDGVRFVVRLLHG
jgi:hypothetical protein